MAKNIAIIGASISGLISAVKLAEKSHNVTIFEKSSSLGGLYNKIDTPFGKFELGMHVLYVNEDQKRILDELFGKSYFSTRKGVKVDLGSSFFNNELFLGSIYPNIITTPYSDIVLKHFEKIEKLQHYIDSPTVLDLIINRFGNDYSENIVSPILQGLWKTDPQKLAFGTIHSFYDLRRTIAVEHSEAVKLKTNPLYDQLLGWPEQKKAINSVFNGRCALFMRYNTKEPNIDEQIKQKGIQIKYNQNISFSNQTLLADNLNITKNFNTVFLTTPLHSLAEQSIVNKLDFINLAIYYFELEEDISSEIPTYYILGHDPKVLFSRIVNYDSYNDQKKTKVISAEITFRDDEPYIDQLIQDIEKIHKKIKIKNYYKYPKTLQVPIPSINNNTILNELLNTITITSLQAKIIDSGMRTDLGRFFSHDTIQGAYDATMDL